MMSFLWPQYLWFSLLLPLVIAVYVLAHRRRERLTNQFADTHLQAAIMNRAPKRSTWLLTILQLLALAFLLLAAARPQASPPLPINKAAVVIAIDASRSMLADDLEPSRLERARELAQDFVRQAPATTQIGLVSFSDLASVLVPPTTDRALLFDALEQVQPAQNTSLTSAIVTGVRMMPGRKGLAPPEALEPPGGFGGLPLEDNPEDIEENPAPGSLLIFSDGVSNVSDNPELPLDTALGIAANFASDNNVQLYAIALGREGGTVAEIDGQNYFIPFEPENLQRLADLSQGEYIFPPEPDELRAIFRDLSTVIRWELREIEVSALFTGLAAILMLLAAGLSLKLRRSVP